MAAAQFSIFGKVTDLQTGEILPGATISLTSPAVKVISDVKGAYRIENLPAGAYALQVSYIGYQTITRNIIVNANAVNDFALLSGTIITDEVTVNGTRAQKNSAATFTNLSKADIAKNNLGQDLPFLLDQTPSLVTQSDAGAGVGYTYIHIRGSDGTRINVTINGIPYNDSEEQATFFVDVPDFASSVDNIQVQRGVGTSTN